jgi:hypothetical protein
MIEKVRIVSQQKIRNHQVIEIETPKNGIVDFPIYIFTENGPKFNVDNISLGYQHCSFDSDYLANKTTMSLLIKNMPNLFDNNQNSIFIEFKNKREKK